MYIYIGFRNFIIHISFLVEYIHTYGFFDLAFLAWVKQGPEYLACLWPLSFSPRGRKMFITTKNKVELSKNYFLAQSKNFLQQGNNLCMMKILKGSTYSIENSIQFKQGRYLSQNVKAIHLIQKLKWRNAWEKFFLTDMWIIGFQFLACEIYIFLYSIYIQYIYHIYPGKICSMFSFS